MTYSIALRFVLPLLLLTAACNGSSDTVLDDVGLACAEGIADAALPVTVDFQSCLSSSCDHLQSAECTVTLDGTTLTVEATATIHHPDNPTNTCTADCGSAFAECETPILAEGTYTLVYGDQSTELVVPTDAPADAEPTCVEAR